jgi:preprotein translocase subunit YajC
MYRMDAFLMLAQMCAPQQGGAEQGGGSMMFLLMMIAMIAIMYFIVYRPQVKARKRLEASIREIKKGDRVLTTGGLYGHIVGTSDTVAVLEIDKEKGVKVEINKSMIAQVFPKE